jgi:uncharacterized protein (DUF3084 family)
MKEALKEKKKGRKPKGYIAKEEDLVIEMEKLRRELEETKKAKKEIEKENRYTKDQLWVARHALNFWEKQGRIDLKKNPTLQKVIKNIFSEVPKKPYGPEEK